MAVTRSYTYLGAMKTRPLGGGDYKLAIGSYAIEAADLYDRDARPSLTFPHFSNVVGVLGIYGDLVANTGNPPVVVSISGNVVTFGVLEGAAAGTIFSEKTDDEAYGQIFTFYAVVAGH